MNITKSHKIKLVKNFQDIKKTVVSYFKNDKKNIEGNEKIN